MSCIQPQTRKVKTRWLGYTTIKIDCRHCLNCLIKRTSQIEFLAQRELVENYMSGKSASFVTLTYDDDHLPRTKDGFITLERSHVQKFIKNMRRQMEYHKAVITFKYLYCGEYGDGSHTNPNGTSTARSHYHLIFIGLSPDQVKVFTRKLWKYGLCDIGPLSAGGLRYICKYMTKASPTKEVKALREAAEVQNPFFYHSVGIGKSWIDKHLHDIVKDGFTFYSNGQKQLFPAHVIRYVAYHTCTNPKPYIQKYLAENILNQAKGKGKSFMKYDFEKSYIREQYLMAALRSQGKPVDDIINNKHWAKPYHELDRDPAYMSELLKAALQ